MISHRRREIDAGRGGGVTKLAQRHIPARHTPTVIHARVDQQRADRFSLNMNRAYRLYDDEVSFHTGLYIYS